MELQVLDAMTIVLFKQVITLITNKMVNSLSWQSSLFVEIKSKLGLNNVILLIQDV
jgi:hypothetical protein